MDAVGNLARSQRGLADEVGAMRRAAVRYQTRNDARRRRQEEETRDLQQRVARLEGRAATGDRRTYASVTEMDDSPNQLTTSSVRTSAQGIDRASPPAGGTAQPGGDREERDQREQQQQQQQQWQQQQQQWQQQQRASTAVQLYTGGARGVAQLFHTTAAEEQARRQQCMGELHAREVQARAAGAMDLRGYGDVRWRQQRPQGAEETVGQRPRRDGCNWSHSAKDIPIQDRRFRLQARTSVSCRQYACDCCGLAGGIDAGYSRYCACPATVDAGGFCLGCWDRYNRYTDFGYEPPRWRRAVGAGGAALCSNVNCACCIPSVRGNLCAQPRQAASNLCAGCAGH
jgi:hypothetical protein